MSSAGALLAAGLTSLALGLIIYSRDRKGQVHRSLLMLSLAATGWAFGFALMERSSGPGFALLFARAGQASLCLVAGFYLRFVLSLLKDKSPYQLFATISLRIAGLLFILSWTPLVIRDAVIGSALPWAPLAGPFFGLFVPWFAATMLMGLYILLKEYRQALGFRRNQLRYVILASIPGILAFLSLFPWAFGISTSAFPQGLLAFYALIAYAILRWRLMDISIVVKNTLLYASLYSVLVGLFVVVVVFFGQWFFYGPQALDRRVIWMCLVALSIVTLLVRPLDAWLRSVTDRLLFQKKYEWQKTLKQASKGMTQVTSADKLLKLMVHFIGFKLRVTHVAILQRTGDQYLLKASRGRDKRPVGFKIGRDNPLVAWLEEKKEVLTADEVRAWLRSEKLFPHRTVIRRTLEETQGQMRLLGAQVCVPAFAKFQMLGFLVLGEKLSGDPYTQEDLDVLSTLASEGAIALENAQLYEQLFQRMGEIETLYQREHRLFIHTAIALAAAVDARDPYTHGHTERSTAYANAIVDQMIHPEIASNPRFKEMITIAALLHDIGKIGIPDEILRKPAKLTPKEMKKMEEHSVVGAIILQPIKGMDEVAKAVKAHHERYDGKGYPDGLRGNEIPLMTRIISVADTFDSMTTDRPYRKRLSDASAVKEVETHAGTQFDPAVVQAFLKAYQKGLLMKRPVEAAEMIG